jgi:integrase/recombinase XerC
VTAPQGPMLPQWASVWADFERSHYHQSDRTLNSRRATINRLAHWLATEEGGNITSPHEVTRQHLQRYMAAAQASCHGSGVLSVYSALRVWWRWFAAEYRDCADCGDEGNRYHAPCPLNPMSSVKSPAPSKHRSRTVPVLTAGQVDALLGTVRGKDPASVRDRALITMLLETGMRRGELRGLDLDDISVSGRDGGGTAVVRHAKNSRPRVVTFGPETALALSRWLRKRPEGGEALFTGTSAATRLSYQAFADIVARRGEAAGIPGLHPHMFRHTWADAHYRAGTPEAVMRSLGGWQGNIPLTYGAGAAEERAIAQGLAKPTLSLIRSREERRRGRAS